MTGNNNKNLYWAAIFSLAFLWIFTGLTSVFFSPEIGYQILSKAGVTGRLSDASVYGGGLLDVALGVWLLSGCRLKLCCIVQIITIATYTLLLTVIDWSFWLHPFGPMTKNFPIAVLILFVSVLDKNNHKCDL